MVIERCRSVLGVLEEEHFTGVQYVTHYLETQPTNADLRELTPPLFEQRREFPFPVSDTATWTFLKGVLLDNGSGSHKNSNVSWFIETILPLFQDKDESAIVGPAPLACALWYLSGLWEHTAKMFAPEPDVAQAWQVVIDTVEDTIREQYRIDESRHVRKALAKLLKSAITNRTVVDENTDDVVRHLGKAARHLARFSPLYSYLNRAATWLRFHPHVATYIGAATRFRNGYRHLYRSIATFPSGEPLFECRIAPLKNTVIVSPFSKSE
jgi:hypothetical protein